MDKCSEKMGSEYEEEEYETQYFGFTPSSVANEVYNVNFDYVDDAVQIVDKLLCVKYPDISVDVIRKGSEGLRKEIINSLEKSCIRFDMYLLNNILRIPDDVVLPEDLVHEDESLKRVDESKLDIEIEELLNRITDKLRAVHQFRQENEQLDSLITSYQTMLDVIKGIECSFANIEAASLPEFITKQGDTARELLKAMNSINNEIVDA